jgi:N4-gp56 family major capsid protein
MAATEFTVGHALAVQRWRSDFATEPEKKMALAKYMGTGANAPIVILKDLQKQAGEKITVDLFMKMTGDGIEGDDTIEGTAAEEALTTFTDSLFINQRRKGTKSKGKMSEQRVLYDMRKKGKEALATWFAEDYDAQLMIYLAGARGVDTSLHVPTTFTSRASNSLNSPDTGHLIYAGDASAKTDLDSGDIMNLDVVDKIIAQIETTDPAIMPIMVNGEQTYLLLMHPWQAFDLRKAVSGNDWMDIHKNADGKDNMIYKNALGEHNGIVLQKHRNVIRFSDYGSGADQGAARALLIGSQAGMIAWGGSVSGVDRYSWNEETDDRGNALVITVGAIYGCKGSYFNSKWYGRLAVDTYCDDPNT